MGENLSQLFIWQAINIHNIYRTQKRGTPKETIIMSLKKKMGKWTDGNSSNEVEMIDQKKAMIECNAWKNVHYPTIM